MSFQYIEPLEEKPQIKRKTYRRISTAEQILKEFMQSNVKYAKVSFEKLKGEYKSPAFCSRAIGRVATRLNLQNEITVYSDENNVYLERSK